MKRNAAIPGICLLAICGLALALGQGCRPASSLEREDASVVFVCRNGVAMSVWSALTFERLAQKRGLEVRASSRAAAATFTDVPLNMRVGLALDGYRIGDYRPRVIGDGDVARADRVVLIDTDLPVSITPGGAAVERWDGFPAMRDEYFASRAALQKRVEDLVSRMASEEKVP